jgi:pimeloyl-ACP methyl ester carboxylesterase
VHDWAARSACASRSSIPSASRGLSFSTRASAEAAAERYLAALPCRRASSAVRSTSGGLESGTAQGLADNVRAAYDAPFPTPESKAGALAFPELVPTEPEHPNTAPMNRVRDALRTWHTPALVVWGAEDDVPAPQYPHGLVEPSRRTGPCPTPAPPLPPGGPAGRSGEAIRDSFSQCTKACRCLSERRPCTLELPSATSRRALAAGPR